MPFYSKKSQKIRIKNATTTEMRIRLGLSQAQLGSIFGVSREYITLVESGKRNLNSDAHLLLTTMYLQFHELETGKLASDRSVETMLFLNDEYRKLLPKMQTSEQLLRTKMKQLNKELEEMKQRAENAGRSIIVYTTSINKLRKLEIPGGKIEKQIEGLELYKQQSYNNLLTCWEPEQAKLHGKIEALAGEAKALRRYRTKVTREHNPFKK